MKRHSGYEYREENTAIKRKRRENTAIKEERT